MVGFLINLSRTYRRPAFNVKEVFHAR
jgi:hypothetical protein